MSDNRINDYEKYRYREIAGCFDDHADTVVPHMVHHQMEHIQGFTQSHWMLPLGECLRRFAPAAAMVDEFVETTLNTNKAQLLPSNYGTFWSLVVFKDFVPQNRPCTQIIDAKAA
jgi:hypothetical protein